MKTKINTLDALITAHRQWLQTNHYSVATQQVQRMDLRKFQGWCRERSIDLLIDITLKDLEAYQRWLYHQKNSQGRSLSIAYQYKLLWAVTDIFRWIHEQGGLLTNPAAGLILPKRPHHAKDVLSCDDIEQVLAQPSLKTAVSLRDRAMLEVLYAAALRRGELLRLNQDDIDRHYRLLTIRQSKGRKDRVVPVSARALHWIQRYQQTGRPQLQTAISDNALFLNRRGQRLQMNACQVLINRYLTQAVPHKSGGCHLIRHSVATLLLNQGCDIRVIQEFLGHKDLKTTQHYLHINVTHLKKIYEQYHPSARQS